MTTDLVNVPSAYLRETNAAVGDSFRAMREAVVKSGPLDANTCELIAIASFATVGFEPSFKRHALRLLIAGVPKAALQQAVMVTLGATTAMPTVTNALHWIDDVCEEHAASR